MIRLTFRYSEYINLICNWLKISAEIVPMAVLLQKSQKIF